MDLILKAALGAAVVIILAILAKTKNYYIAGLVPLLQGWCRCSRPSP